MSRLPNAEQAHVDQKKVVHYLLDLTSVKGAAKARFFLAFGFTIDAWEIFAEACKQHGRTNKIVETRITAHGVNYSIVGALNTPDQRNPQVRSVWCILHEEPIPFLVTAYPSQGSIDDAPL